MSGNSKIELNATLERLIDPEVELNSDDAIAIINLMKDVPLMGNVRTTQGQGGGSQGNVTGHTPEHGNLSVNTSSKQSETEDIDYKPIRIGQYKLYKGNAHIDANYIRIEHFWKADLSTASETEEYPTYLLIYSDDHQKIDFGKIVTESANLTFSFFYKLMTSLWVYKIFFIWLYYVIFLRYKASMEIQTELIDIYKGKHAGQKKIFSRKLQTMLMK